MVFTPCDPCDCIPSNISNDSFKQSVLSLLCGISAASGGTTTLYDTQILCDPTTQARVIVRYGYHSDGTVVGISAYNLDGTAYGGSITALVDCAVFAETAFSYAEDSASASGNVGAFVLGVRNTALADQTSADGDYGAFTINIKGAQFVDINSSAQQSSALGLLKLEDAASASGDAAVAIVGKRVDTAASQTSTDGDYTVPSLNSFGAFQLNLDSTFQAAAATGILKLEDAASASGDAGVGLLLKRLDAAAIQTSADGDYTLPVTNQYGQVRVGINRTFQVSDADSILKAEDAVAVDGDAGVAIILKRTDTAASQTSADGDYTIPVANSFGGQHVNIDSGFQKAQATGILKVEDTPQVDADSGVGILIRADDTPQSSLVSASGDYSFLKGNTLGVIYTNIDFNAQVNTANGLLKQEDAVSASGDAGVGFLLKRLDAAATQTSADGDYTLPVTNQYGQIRVGINRTFQVTDADSLLKAEDAAAVDGDAGVVHLYKRTDTASSQTSADGDYTVPVANSVGAQHINIDSSFQATAATGILKLEDAASGSGDAGVAVLMKRTDTAASQTSADGDYTLPVANSFGAAHINIDSGFQKAQATGILKVEDTAQVDADSGAAILIRADDTPQSTLVNASGDYCFPKCNTSGALYANIDFNSQVNTGNGLLKQEDAASSSGTAGVFILAIRNDTPTTVTTSADADYSQISVDSAGRQYVIQNAYTAGGATPYKLISAATTNGTNVKASAGQIYTISVFNTNAAARYLKLYDKASAPTVGTDVPVNTYTIPGSAVGAGFVLGIPVGKVFTLGIGFGLTTGIADNDTGAVGANEIVVNLDYK